MQIPQYLVLGHQLAERFDDPRNFLRNWFGIFGELPREYPIIMSNFQYWIRYTSKPGLILNHFDRFLKELSDPSPLLDFLESYPSAFEILWACLSKAPYLSTILSRNPEDFYWLMEEASFGESLDHSALKRSFENTVLGFSSPYRQQAFLHRLHRRHFLRIAVRDLVDKATFRESIRDLSHLADGLIHTVTRLVKTQFSGQNRWPDSEFVVLALGKLGGTELNYSSDIDLMFVYGSDGTLPSGETYSHAFQKAAEEICRILNEQSEHGMLYRVDTRLRPDGTSGILCQSLSAYLHYYEGRGRLWERQMLIKARPVAGDLQFGAHVLDAFKPFIFPRSIRYPFREILKMRGRSETSTDSGLNVKTDPGGIRDIEFIVQALQLQFGGRNPQLQTGHTLDALDRLAAGEEYLSTEESDTLRDHYVFLREIEHALQLQENLQTHILPEREPKQLLVTDALGMEYQQIRKETLQAMDNVRDIYNRIFTGATESKNRDYENYTEQDWEKYFNRREFTHPQKAASQIDSLARGRFPDNFDVQTQQAFWQLCPHLLGYIQETPVPAEVLTDFERVMRAYQAVGSLYGIFAEYPDVLKLIIQLLSQYRNLTPWLVQQPDLLESVLHLPGEPITGKELESTFEPLTNRDIPSEEWLDQAFQKYHRAVLLIICQQLSGKLSLPETAALYSAAHRSLVAAGLDYWLPDLEEYLTVVLAGSAALGQMDYSSDLDMLFFFHPVDDLPEFSAHIKEFISIITRYTPRGRLVSLDFRLRPEGKSAPLIMAADEYAHYVRERMQAWEFVAMEHRRYLWGNEELYQRLSAALDDRASNRAAQYSFWEELITWEKKALREKSRPDSGDFTYHVGGIFPTKNSLDWLRFLDKYVSTPEMNAERLQNNLTTLRRLRWYLSFNHQGAVDRLPHAGESRRKLAELTRYKSGEELRQVMSELLDQNREINQQLREELLQKFD